MKLQDMNAIIRATPNMVPLFKVTKVVPWMTRMNIAVGDTFFYHANTGAWVPTKSKCAFNTKLGATQVEFVEYVDANKTPPTWDLNMTWLKAIIECSVIL